MISTILNHFEIFQMVFDLRENVQVLFLTAHRAVIEKQDIAISQLIFTSVFRENIKLLNNEKK